MSVSVPLDDSGMIGRECPSESCSPGYFKVKPGTGITGDQTVAYCPYCRTVGEPNDFHTTAQIEYAKKIAINEATTGLNDMLRIGLGLDHRGKKKIGGGLLSIEMSLTPARPSAVGRPIDEELRRDLVCSQCGLSHAVFGLAVWCPDCGADLFLAHVREELAVIRCILAAVPSRRAELGARVAARDVENALEDVVSIFETVLKLMIRFDLKSQGRSDDEIADALENRVRNKFQSITLGSTVFQDLTGRPLFEGDTSVDVATLTNTFEKRHPITHNLGIVDRKYIKRVELGELLGREVRVSAEEVLQSIDAVERVFTRTYRSAPIDAVGSEQST